MTQAQAITRAVESAALLLGPVLGSSLLLMLGPGAGLRFDALTFGDGDCVDDSATIAVAARILATTYRASVDLRLAAVVYDYPGAPSTILRCGVTSTVAQLPPTVIVKRSNTPVLTLPREAAALTFLARYPRLRELVPQCYGLDPAGAVLIMGDLGVGPDYLLGNILFGPDPQRAETALIAFTRALGLLHSCTVDQQGAYAHLCAQYRVSQRSRHRIHRLLTDLASLGAILTSQGISMSPAIDQEIRTVLADLRSPGPFLTFTHGDATPANVLCTGAGVRVFDFETSEYRHALLDGAFPCLRYLYSVWARRIPFPVQQRMLAAYRDALIEGCPAAADDTCFDRALASAGAGWLAGLCALIPSVINRDQPWGRATIRQRIITGLEHFVRVSEELQRLPRLARASRALTHHLRQTWPESDCTLPYYPAFDGPAEASPPRGSRRGG